MKEDIIIQPDLFWEDENLTPNIIEAANWFNCLPMSLQDYHIGKLAMRRYFRGSLDLARLSGRKYDFCNALNWLPRFRLISLNHRGYFNDLKEILTQMLEKKEVKFVRPVEPWKLFAGQIYDRTKLYNEVAFLRQNKNVFPEEVICLVNNAAKIDKEWRCIFVNGKYIDGSQYMVDEELNVEPGCPNSVIEFAQMIAKDEYFTNIFDFVIDVAEVDGKLWLIELNGFETSSFYAADLAKIYGAWSKI